MPGPQQVKTWKKHDRKLGDKDIQERGMWIGLSNWEKDVKIFVSHVNANKR
jgi:hypothetical protein